VVWSESTKVGCGQAASASTVYVVCNYAPPGNFPRSPFVGGRAPQPAPTAEVSEPTVAVPTPTATSRTQPTATPPAQPTTAPVQPTATSAGKLYSWSTWVSDLGLDIPDDSSDPATQGIQVTKAGKIAAIGVRVQITHPYVGDLTIVLVHPDGTSVTLRNQAGGSADDIDAVYGLGGIPVSGLGALNGKPLAGTWQVQVYDGAAEDTGTLEAVSLDFSYTTN
jgi:subtilisin-like proprotein convertase family protein